MPTVKRPVKRLCHNCFAKYKSNTEKLVFLLERFIFLYSNILLKTHGREYLSMKTDISIFIESLNILILHTCARH